MRKAPPTRFVGLDIGNSVELCIVAHDQVIRRATITREDDYKEHIGPGTERALVVLEACREAWYLYDLFVGWGHEVWIVDTTRARKLGIGEHKRKNDRIDAETLARAAYEGRVPRAWVLSHSSQALRADLQTRRLLVSTRTSFVVAIRGQLRAQGLRIASCKAHDFVKKLDKTELSPLLREQIEPLVAVLRTLNPQIDQIDKKLDEHLAELPVVGLLTTARGVGRIVAAAFISVIDTPGRFQNAHQVQSYLGLVPSEYTSGKRKLGAITKMGNAYLRAMLVQAAWALMNMRCSDPLKYWGMRISKKRGKRVAVVAVARRLAGILWAMWKNNKAYNPELLGKQSARGKRKEAAETQTSATHLAICAEQARSHKQTAESQTSTVAKPGTVTGAAGSRSKSAAGSRSKSAKTRATA